MSMIPPTLHHGMIWLGLSYRQKELINTQTGGSPYGASHLANSTADNTLSSDEQNLCEAQGKRLASLALKLAP